MVNQPERPPLLPSFHPSISPFPSLSAPSVLCPHSEFSQQFRSAPPFLSTDFRGNNCFHFILFVRPFLRSFFQSSFLPFLSTATDGKRGRATDRPTERPSSDFPILSLFFPLGRQNPFTQLHFLQKVSSQRSRGRRAEEEEGKEAIQGLERERRGKRGG